MTAIISIAATIAYLFAGMLLCYLGGRASQAPAGPNKAGFALIAWPLALAWLLICRLGELAHDAGRKENP